MDLTYRCSMKSYIQPFEEYLARRELQALVGNQFDAVQGCRIEDRDWPLPFGLDVGYFLDHLAYWETLSNGQVRPTRQVLRESTASGGDAVFTAPAADSSFSFQFDDVCDLPQRRRLRYGTHGLHEYRGKFFPQLVRSFLNIGKVGPGAVVLDPMCGSGTTLVEAVLGGYRSFGLDLNPLSVFMADVKCRCLSLDWREVDQRLEEFLDYLAAPGARNAGYLEGLAEEDVAYLRRWFGEGTLNDLDHVMTEVQERYAGTVYGDLLALSLSNILRKVSWQKEDDLRVRKELLESPLDVYEVLGREISRVRGPLVRFLQLESVGGWSHGEFEVLEADARNLCMNSVVAPGSIDVVITSPPYATALPYVDTDRLSLIFLGLLPRAGHRPRERQLIGHREINKTLRSSYWEEFEDAMHQLPCDVVELVSLIHRLNERADVGFRRKNLSSLLARYFLDMREVLRGIKVSLRSGGNAFLVVGSNRTTAGSIEVAIETPALLASMGEGVGLHLVERIPMDMLVSRDIFRNNTTPTEEILIFSKHEPG